MFLYILEIAGGEKLSLSVNDTKWVYSYYFSNSENVFALIL